VIIDTSVLVAILRDEPDATALMQAIRHAKRRAMSAATYVELGSVIDRFGDPLLQAGIDQLIADLGMVIDPVTETQARLARQAHRLFGKGSGHPAGLNFGDCFAYALARDKGEPLLFKGADFAATDIPFVGPISERRRLSELLAAYSTG
jgi:ribonuclease VapC